MVTEAIGPMYFLSPLALHMPVGDPVDAAAHSLFLPSSEVPASPVKVEGGNLLQQPKPPR